MSSDAAPFPSWAAREARRLSLRTETPEASRSLSRETGDAFVDLLLLVGAVGPIPRLVAVLALAHIRQCSERRAYTIVTGCLACGVLDSGVALNDRVGATRTVKDILFPGPEWDAYADRLRLPRQALFRPAGPWQPGAHLLSMALLHAAVGPYTVHADGDFLETLERMPRGGPASSRHDSIDRQRSGFQPSPHAVLRPGHLIGAVPVHSHSPGSGGVTAPALIFLGDGLTSDRFLDEAMPRLLSHGPFTICVNAEATFRYRKDLAERVHATLNLVKSLGRSAVREVGGATDASRAEHFASTRDAVAPRPMSTEEAKRIRDNLEVLVERHDMRDRAGT